MLFITCKPIKTIGIEKYFTFMDRPAPSEEIFFCSGSYKEKNYKEIGSQEFLKNIKESSYKQILLYIHGFNNQPEDALSASELLQNLCELKEPGNILVIPILWPCGDKNGIIRDYWSDQQSSDMSGFALSRGLNKFITWQQKNVNDDTPCFKYVNILSHSMGNRVLRSMVEKYTKYFGNDYTPMLFRNIFMVAADVSNDTLEKGKEGNCITYATKNLTIYYAGDDQALRGSKIINASTTGIKRRLGHSGPTSKTNAVNMVTIDCDKYNSKYDILGHSYFIHLNNWHDNKPLKDCGGKIFDHIYDCLSTGKVENNLEKKPALFKFLGN